MIARYRSILRSYMTTVRMALDLLRILPVHMLILSHFLGLVIVCHITNTPFTEPQRLEMIRYLRSVQTPEGGWGL